MRETFTYIEMKNRGSYPVMRLRLLLILLFFIFIIVKGYGQPGNSYKPASIKYVPADTTSEYSGPDDDYAEISITLNVSRIGSLEIPAVINGQKIYLSVSDLFDFLKIRNVATADYDSVSGFFINPKAIYLLDKTNNRIIYQGRSYTLKPDDMIHTASALYLKLDDFGQIFGLDCVFDFRSLTVTLNTKIELPAIRELQMEMMRRNISQLKGERKADTTIRKSFHMFHLGMADWSVLSSQQTTGVSSSRVNLAIGAIIAGGEVDLSLNYSSEQKIDLRQQYYQWRYVNNNHSALRQVIAGKLFAQSTSSIYAPVTGIQLTNTPTTYRRSYGTYTLSNTAEPGWVVELYLNNVMVNYTKADASGFYSFEVPMVYGNSVVKLRFYGPWGEERTSEKYMSIPFNFIPFHQFEYNLAAGIVDDDKKSLYSRATFNYGLSRHITIGGGMEFLSSVESGKYMPFVNASFRLGTHLLVSGEHTRGVRSQGILSVRLPSNLQAELSYVKYNKDQTAIKVNYLDERKLAISMPFRAKKFTAFSRFSLSQFTAPYNKLIFATRAMKYTSAELLISAVVAGVSANLTTYAVINNPDYPLAHTSLSLTFRLPAGIRLTPQAQYEYHQKKISMFKAEAEKNISNRGFLNIAYEKLFVKEIIPSSAITIGLRYNFSFAQTFFGAAKSGNTITTTQSARGSLVYDGKTNYLAVSDQNSVGKGGITLVPYLDINCNGQRDPGEPKAYGLNLHIYGGKIERNDRDTIIRITGVDANTNCFIELDKNSFDNVAWQIAKPTLSITIEPNTLKFIEIPVAVVGEVSGTVFLNDAKGKNGLARIIMNIYNKDGVFRGRTITEGDGHFSFFGLAPGTYAASIDEMQLKKLQMRTSPPLSFKILPNRDGDVADGLQFVLQPTPINK